MFENKSGHIRKKGFGLGETQAALGNFVSPRVYLAPCASSGISGCLWKYPDSPGVFEVSPGVSRCLWIYRKSPGISECLWEIPRHLWVSLKILWSLGVFGRLWMALNLLNTLRVSWKCITLLGNVTGYFGVFQGPYPWKPAPTFRVRHSTKLKIENSEKHTYER